MPLGMENVSKLPKITAALLEKGYREAEWKKFSAAISCASWGRWRSERSPEPVIGGSPVCMG